jgi:protein SOK2
MFDPPIKHLGYFICLMTPEVESYVEENKIMATRSPNTHYSAQPAPYDPPHTAYGMPHFTHASHPPFPYVQSEYHDPFQYTPSSFRNYVSDPSGQSGPPGMKPRVITTLWEDEGTLCFQVEAKGICVARREGQSISVALSDCFTTLP